MAVKKQTYEENISEIDKILEKFENEEYLLMTRLLNMKKQSSL
jgi:hypothetical protein